MLHNRFAGEGKMSRMPDLDCYRSIDDVQFKVCSFTNKIHWLSGGWKKSS
jgi:hypothetical protein